VSCPEDNCNGTLVQKQSRRGKIFFGCDQYPKCQFAMWNKPRATTCPKCNYSIMEEKTTRKDGFYLQCPKCKHREMVEELTG
ncbi:MAG: topoisomerase DNA-binding C4 zinc finger domain-containing protein, partial [Calditrichaeota bacterium]|nr:topoisomerase DNA-binding C4 zinc finger domain-containing protein [Calditrichota bacterium]